jgi:hypothetical protein
LSDDSLAPVESKFNAGIAILERINNEHLKINRLNTKHKYDQMIDCFVNIRNDLNDRLTKDQRSNCDRFEHMVQGEMQSKNKKKGTNVQLLMKYLRYLVDLEKLHGIRLPDKDDFLEPDW